MNAEVEARAIHIILVTTPGTKAEKVHRDVMEETIRLAREHGTVRG